MSLLDQMQADVEPLPIPSEESLFRLRQAIQRKLEAEKEMEENEASKRLIQERIDHLTFKIIPGIFAELRLKSFELEDVIVEVNKKYFAAITKKNEVEAFQWLRDNGHGPIIKNEVKAEFGKGRDEDVQKFLDALPEGIEATRRESVNTATLGAFVREQTEAGNLGLPKELLGVHILDVAKITPTKKGKR